MLILSFSNQYVVPLQILMSFIDLHTFLTMRYNHCFININSKYLFVLINYLHSEK